MQLGEAHFYNNLKVNCRIKQCNKAVAFIFLIHFLLVVAHYSYEGSRLYVCVCSLWDNLFIRKEGHRYMQREEELKQKSSQVITLILAGPLSAFLSLLWQETMTCRYFELCYCHLQTQTPRTHAHKHTAKPKDLHCYWHKKPNIVCMAIRYPVFKDFLAPSLTTISTYKYL